MKRKFEDSTIMGAPSNQCVQYKYCVCFDKLTAVPKPCRYEGLLTATTVIFVGKVDSYMSTRNSV